MLQPNSKQTALVAARGAFALAAMPRRRIDDCFLFAVAEGELHGVAGVEVFGAAYQRTVFFAMHHDEAAREDAFEGESFEHA